MKVSVLHGKQVAHLELPPSTTLSELCDGLAARFSLPDPQAIKFRLHEGQPPLRVRDHPTATLESAGFTNGCKVRVSVSKHASAAAAADGQHGRHAEPERQQGDKQQQRNQQPGCAPGAPATASGAQFEKGQRVMYRTREGTWQEAKVVGVDYSILPFSYGIEIDGHYRETEATRLAPLDEAEAAAA